MGVGKCVYVAIKGKYVACYTFMLVKYLYNATFGIPTYAKQTYMEKLKAEAVTVTVTPAVISGHKSTKFC